MRAKDDKSGIVLQCDPSGTILRVIRDDLGVTAGRDSSSTLYGIVDQHSQVKAREFLQAAIESHATFGWELNVHCEGQITGLLLTGGLTDEGIIVCGFPSRAGMDKLFDEIMKIQNEQMNALRMALKKEQLETATHHQREQDLLGEFSRLNSELVNAQRELARRNAELADANTQLESLATTDGLTGLKNHRAFQEALECEWARAKRYGSSLSLLMMDVDRFKQFNDQFGHPAGDRVLKQVAKSIASECRLDSFVARYGGEEFAVVLPNCGCQEADGIAERVRRAVELGPWDLRPVTASLGRATFLDSMPNSAALVAQADAALYRAKVSGRNRVCSDSDVAGTMLALMT